jgi:hypothetical protein
MIRKALAFTFLVTSALAAPPDGADPALSSWYQSLKQPGTGYLCCSIADCRNVITRERNGNIEAFISRETFHDGTDEWVVVPESIILHGHDNLTGAPVLCWYNHQVRCFVEASGT